MTTVITSKRALIEFCLNEASKLISVQKYYLAIPAVIQALRFSKDVDGDKSLTIVDPYLVLAQIYLSLNQLNKAEEYLALARWIVINTAQCPDKLVSYLHMLMGRVMTAKVLFSSLSHKSSTCCNLCQLYY